MLLDEGKIEYNPGRRALAKLMANSFYGKLCQREERHEAVYLDKPDQLFKLMRNEHSLSIQDLQIVNEYMILIEHVNKGIFLSPSPFSNVVLGAFVTSQARLKLFNTMQKLGSRCLYTDTDSVIYKHDTFNEEDNPLTGPNLGEYSDELNGKFISCFVSAGPKNYAFQLPNHQSCVKIRGFSLNFASSQKLNFRVLQKMIISIKEGIFRGEEDDNNGNEHTVTIDYPHLIVRQKRKNFRIVTSSQKKIYRPVYMKRQLFWKMSDFSTLPYGYQL